MASPKVVLKCMDGREFAVSKAVALQMQNIRNEIKEDEETIIPVPEFSSPVIAKVLQYCERHALDDDDNNNLRSFDDDFVKIPEDMISNVVMCARELGVERLVDILCKEIADMIKVKSLEEVRKFFNIKNDMTPEEEEQIYNEHWWAFE